MANKRKFIPPQIYASNCFEVTEVINERKMIDKILSEEDVFMDSSNMFIFLRLMAKHCYFDLGFRKKRTLDYLDEFMYKNFPIYYKRGLYDEEMQKDNFPYDYSKHGFVSYYGRIFNTVYNLTQKSPGVCDKDGFWITKSELDYIGKLNNKVLERLAFVFLCYAKLYKLRNQNANGWVYSGKYRDVFSQARITCSVKERYIHIAELEDKGYLYSYQMSESAKNSIYLYKQYQKRMNDAKVTFINDDSEGVIFVNDFRELGYYYRKYKGENIIQCRKCGKLTRGNKNGTKLYCRACAGTEKKYKVSYKFCRCVDCGKVFTISNKFNDRKRKRCDECQEKERKRHNWKMYQQRKSRNSTK